jgi:hypothetical protein
MRRILLVAEVVVGVALAEVELSEPFEVRDLQHRGGELSRAVTDRLEDDDLFRLHPEGGRPYRLEAPGNVLELLAEPLPLPLGRGYPDAPATDLQVITTNGRGGSRK